MPTAPENASSSTAASNGVDCEPDDAWKEQLRKRIEEGLQSMVIDAKDNHASELIKMPEARMRLEADYKQAIQTIRNLASEQYKLELDRERNQRRWTAAVPMTPGWSRYFHQEQQNIMNSIKQSNQTDNSIRTASESPTKERRSAIPKPSNEAPALAPTPVLLSVPPSSSVRPAEVYEKSSPQSIRRTLSGDRDDPGSFRPRAQPSSIDRPSQPSHVSPDNRWPSKSIHSSEHLARPPPRAPPEIWKPAISPAEDALPAKHYNIGRRKDGASMRSTGSGASVRPPITETVPEQEEPKELKRSPSPMARLPSSDKRWDNSLGRSSGLARSSLKAPPEIWKPAMSPAEETLPAKPYNLGRRGNAASTRSTGSSASIRPSITETIAEQADDDDDDESDESAIEVDGYERAQETTELGRVWIFTGRTWISVDKSHKKGKQPDLRGNSRSPVDADLRSDDLGLSSSRSDDRHCPIESPGKPPPYHDYREQSSSRDNYAHRHPQGGRGRERRLDREYDKREEDVRKKEEEIWLREEEMKRKEIDARRKEEEIWRMEEEAKRKEEDARKKEEDIWRMSEVKRKEDDPRKKEEEIRGMAKEVKRKEDTRKKGEEIRRMEEEVKRKEENVRKKGEEIWRMEEEAKRKEEDARKKEEEIWRKEEEVKRKEEDVRKKGEEIRRMEEEVKRKEEIVRKKGEEIWRMEEEAKRKEEEARKKEEEIWRKEEEVRWKEEEVRKKGEEIWKKEEEVRWKEDVRKGEEIWRIEEEAKRKEEDARKKEEEIWRKEQEVKRKEEDVRKKGEEISKKEEEVKWKEEDVRKKEEDIRRMEEEVKRKEEDAARKAKKAKKVEAVVMKKEADAKRKEKELRIKEEDAKRKEEAARLGEEVR